MPRTKKTEEETATPDDDFTDSPLWDLPAVDEDVIAKLKNCGISTLEMLRVTPKDELMDPLKDGGAGLTEERAEKLLKQVTAKIQPTEFIKAGDAAPIEYIPTGSTALDGIAKGYGVKETTELAGDYGLGKTVMCCTAAVLCWKKFNKDTLYIRTETHQEFGRDFFDLIAKSREIEYDSANHLHIGTCLTVRDQLDAIKRADTFLKEHDIKLLIIDSIGGNLRPELQGRGLLGERQQLVIAYSRMLSRMAQVFDMSVIVTNQIIASPDPYAPTFNPAFGGSLQHNVGKLIGIQGTSEKGAKEGYGNPYHKNIKDTGIRAITVIKAYGLPVSTVMCKLTNKGLDDIEE